MASTLLSFCLSAIAKQFGHKQSISASAIGIDGYAIHQHEPSELPQRSNSVHLLHVLICIVAIFQMQ